MGAPFLDIPIHELIYHVYMSFGLVLLLFRLLIIPFAVSAVVGLFALRPIIKRRLVRSFIVGSVPAVLVFSLVIDPMYAMPFRWGSFITLLIILAVVLSAACYCAQHYCLALNRNYWRGCLGQSSNMFLSKFGLWGILLLALFLFNYVVYSLFHVQSINSVVLSDRLLPVWAISQLSYAIGEEVFFRGYLLCMLSYKLRNWSWGELASSLIVAVLFIILHTSEEELLFKFVQITPFALVINIVFRSYGLPGAVLFHVVYNLLGDYLLTIFL